MAILLPPRPDGSRLTLDDSARRILIIGANGAGKSRFTRRLLEDLPTQQVFPLSPLKALYGAVDNAAEGNTIDGMYLQAASTSPLMRGATAPPTQLERLMALLLHDEVMNLIRYKVERTGGDAELHATRLDRVLELWREVFPENGVLRRGGELLFTDGEGATRSQLKLSAGEKLVLYYVGGVLYAPENAVIPIENPDMFFHPSTQRRVWDMVEQLRPDCTFIYTTHDLEFASTRTDATTVWVRGCSPNAATYDYDLLPADSPLSEQMYMSIIGARRPVMFIEGDDTRSIDGKLYPLIFPDFTVKPLGSCDRVIESTRVFNSLSGFHHLDSVGIVDRDRRSEREVEYLRAKKIMVPEVAEVENLLLIEEVVRTVAAAHGKDEGKAFAKVKSAVIGMFKQDVRAQALQHTRHYVKRTVEHCIDRRFANIGSLEEHLTGLIDEISPRGVYESFCRDFHTYVVEKDYASILRVYNQKSMLPQSNVASLTGCTDKAHYIGEVLRLLRSDTPYSSRLRTALRRTLMPEEAN
jgi:hypothetical protein